jgi:hypothetical protein
MSPVDGGYLAKIYYRLDKLGGRWIGLEVLSIYAVAYEDKELADVDRLYVI